MHVTWNKGKEKLWDILILSFTVSLTTRVPNVKGDTGKM